MQIEREQVVEFLRGRHLEDLAVKAATELPDPVDTDEHETVGLLNRLGVEIEDLLERGLG